MSCIEHGAKVAVEQCMNIQPEDKVLIVADDASKDIGLAIRKEALNRTKMVRFFNIDLPAYGGRPLKRMPDDLWQTVGEVTASFFVASAQPGELKVLRSPLLKRIVQTARHAHMVGVDEEIMCTGMNVDYLKVADFTTRLHKRLLQANVMKVTSDAGTDFTVQIGPNQKYIAETGLIHNRGEWDNLPSGEVFCAPRHIEGRLVVNGTLGDWLGQKYKEVDMDATPLIVDIEQRDWGEMSSCKCDNASLLKDFMDYTAASPYSRRVGELGLGTNLFIKKLLKNILQDEKFPGVHIALGDPYEEKTRVGWTCTTHIDMVMTGTTIMLDDEKVMDCGVWLEDRI